MGSLTAENKCFCLWNYLEVRDMTYQKTEGLTHVDGTKKESAFFFFFFLMLLPSSSLFFFLLLPHSFSVSYGSYTLYRAEGGDCT